MSGAARASARRAAPQRLSPSLLVGAGGEDQLPPGESRRTGRRLGVERMVLLSSSSASSHMVVPVSARHLRRQCVAARSTSQGTRASWGVAKPAASMWGHSFARRVSASPRVSRARARHCTAPSSEAYGRGAARTIPRASASRTTAGAGPGPRARRGGGSSGGPFGVGGLSVPQVHGAAGAERGAFRALDVAGNDPVLMAA